MKTRAAAILIQKDKIALIERHRSGKHYFVFPGGKIEAGETASAAARREIEEELGLEVEIEHMVAEVWYEGTPQYYFFGQIISGQFGRGTGKEMSSLIDSKKGSHLPVWMPVDELTTKPVLPRLVAELVLSSYHSEWPTHPLIMTDQPANDIL